MTGAELRAHLQGELLPLWARHGVDQQRGGFFNQLDPSLHPVPEDRKRLLVQARQVWTFATAAAAGEGEGEGGGAFELAGQGVGFLREHFLDRAHGGWLLETTLAGDPLRTEKDLYAHAFVLLALAAYRRAGGGSEVLALADETLEQLDRHLADREHGGYLERASADWRAEPGLRHQNPHMHLFEALLALAEVSGAGGYLERAHALLALLRTRFTAADGSLREQFAPDWSPAPAPEGEALEPGHHFEWSWLLCEYARLSGDASARDDAARVFAFADAHGIDPEHGGVLDAMDPAGRPLRATKRLWPQMEYLHALAVREDPRTDSFASLCFARYVDPATRGWREQADAKGRIISQAMNATSVYHVYGGLRAAAEVL